MRTGKSACATRCEVFCVAMRGSDGCVGLTLVPKERRRVMRQASRAEAYCYGRIACATDGRAAADPWRAFLFARIRIRAGGGFGARNGGALARRRAALNSRAGANDLVCACRGCDLRTAGVSPAFLNFLFAVIFAVCDPRPCTAAARRESPPSRRPAENFRPPRSTYAPPPAPSR